jgi:hypothetical protein
MKKTISTLTLLLLQIILRAQADSSYLLPKRNTLYLEGFGQGLFYSLSYERLYRLDKKVKTSIAIGGTLISSPDYGWGWGLPISYNWIFGQRKNHFELGTGLTYFFEKYDFGTYNHVYATTRVAYRYQRPEGGFFFRFSINYSRGLFESVKLNHNAYYYNTNNRTDYYYFPDAYPPSNSGFGLLSLFSPALGYTF